jgi:hypothetical protein
MSFFLIPFQLFFSLILIYLNYYFIVQEGFFSFMNLLQFDSQVQAYFSLFVLISVSTE